MFYYNSFPAGLQGENKDKRLKIKDKTTPPGPTGCRSRTAQNPSRYRMHDAGYWIKDGVWRPNTTDGPAFVRRSLIEQDIYRSLAMNPDFLTCP
jgi:hypothetical protein